MRVCANPACHGTLDHLRSDAKFCNSACRREADALSLLEAPEGYDARRFWEGYRAVRSPARAREIASYAGAL